MKQNTCSLIFRFPRQSFTRCSQRRCSSTGQNSSWKWCTVHDPKCPRKGSGWCVQVSSQEMPTRTKWALYSPHSGSHRCKMSWSWCRGGCSCLSRKCKASFWLEAASSCSTTHPSSCQRLWIRDVYLIYWKWSLFPSGHLQTVNVSTVRALVECSELLTLIPSDSSWHWS